MLLSTLSRGFLFMRLFRYVLQYKVIFDISTYIHSKFVYLHDLLHFNNYLPDVPVFISFWFSIWFSKSLWNNIVRYIGIVIGTVQCSVILETIRQTIPLPIFKAGMTFKTQVISLTKFLMLKNGTFDSSQTIN